MATTGDELITALNELRRDHEGLAARATITADPALLRDESPVTAVARSLLVHPVSEDEVVALVRLARRCGLAVVPRGGRTGLVGGAIPVVPSVVIDLTRMTAVEELDVPGRFLRIGAGATLGRIDDLLAPHGMMYPPDPASYRRATIGGTVATNAGGLRCVKYGTTDRWIRTLRVVLADGTIEDLGHRVVKDVTGYDLRRLMLGSEGTLGIVVSVGIAFCPRPVDSPMLVAAFGSIEQALAAIRAIGDRVVPSMCELLDRAALGSRDTGALVPLLGAVSSWGPDPTLLLLQVDGAGAAAELALLRDAVAPHAHATRDVDVEHAEAVLDMRRGGSAVRSGGAAPRDETGEAPVEETLVAPVGAVRSLPQDLSVPIHRLESVVRRIRRIADRSGIESRIAAHAGDGNLHLLLLERPEADPVPDAAGAGDARLRAAMERVVHCVLDVGGTVSGEHGIGVAKRDWARRDLGPGVIALHRGIKHALDPEGLMNPRTAF